jgi:hypothetical protein
VAWKLGLICVGLLILWLGFRLSRRLFEPFLGQEPTERRKRMTVLTLTPYLMAIVIKMSAAAISPNPDKTLVLLGAFGATGFFLIWINLLRFWPLGKGRETARPAVQLARSVPWIAIAAVTLALYIGVLGRGIGELPH